MKITAIKTAVCNAEMRNWVFVKVETDQPGLYGWGEAQAPLAPEVACTIVKLLLEPVLAGQEFEGGFEEILGEFPAGQALR